MNIKYILITMGEPYSTFSEIIAKYFAKNKKINRYIILFGNNELIHKQFKKLKYSIPLNKISNFNSLRKNKLNIVNIDFKFSKVFTNITNKSNNYIEECFKRALIFARENKKKCILINGPISKESFLKKKYLGITEYLSAKTKSKNEVMLIYNNELSVSPITTHIPLKYVAKKITKTKILNNILKIDSFYKKTIKKRPKIAVMGLNPHCESIEKYSEEEKIIKPSIKILKKRGILAHGPFAADTFFLKKNVINFDVAVGMYHDQVLTPIKTLYNFNAINLTIGLPFIRISPDHGPNFAMLGKNKSDPSSFFYAMEFIKKFT